jgi:hypothetical protein
MKSILMMIERDIQVGDVFCYRHHPSIRFEILATVGEQYKFIGLNGQVCGGSIFVEPVIESRIYWIRKQGREVNN